jgi:hypothetical protein
MTKSEREAVEGIRSRVEGDKGTVRNRGPSNSQVSGYTPASLSGFALTGTR